MLVLFLFLFVFSLGGAVTYQNVRAQGADVDDIKQNVTDKKMLIDRLKREIDVYQQSLQLRRAQSASLNNQIAILNDEIQKLELSIRVTQEEMNLTQDAILETEQAIREYEHTLDVKRGELAQALRTLRAREGADDFFVLLAHDTVSEYFEDLERIAQLQVNIANIVQDVEKLKTEALQKKSELEHKKEELLRLNDTLTTQQEQITGQRTVKAQLLVDTRRMESQFQLQLNQAKREQAAVENEVVSLEKKLRTEIANSERRKKLESLGSPDFQWPLRGIITATFHDPDYPYRYIFEHPAIDIAARQGTPVRAAASGYVAVAKNGGLRGYSYVMVIHNNGYASVYGHVSKLLVSADDFVEAGQVIAYSGGTPGTPGAGGLTTGPHLHLEIRLNGIPVNPLTYLN